MSFSKLTGVGSDCGPDNGLNNLVKQFGQDRSLQQVNSLFYFFLHKNTLKKIFYLYKFE
jgi:hypothetical protein